MPDPFIAQLGRISGHMLTPNLVRDGIDLTFRNRGLDSDLLYLNVSDKRLGINTDSPVFNLDVSSIIKTTDTIVDEATIADLTFSATSVISSLSGLPINIKPAGNDPTVIFDRMGTTSLLFDGNSIQSLDNQDIVLDPAGVGIVDIQSSAIIRNDLFVLGDIFIDGSLSTSGNIIIGDEFLDVVIINTNLTQDIEPKFDLTFDIGKENIRWAAAYINDWQYIENIIPFSAIVNNSILLGDSDNTIRTIQPNQDLLITPDTGMYFIEDLKFEDNTITNLLNTPLTLTSQGRGYYRFQGNNAMLFPAGTSAERPNLPEIGDTRWNTDLGYLECFDGNVYITSIGPGDIVDLTDMEDLGNIYSLILG